MRVRSAKVGDGTFEFRWDSPNDFVAFAWRGCARSSGLEWQSQGVRECSRIWRYGSGSLGSKPAVRRAKPAKRTGNQDSTCFAFWTSKNIWIRRYAWLRAWPRKWWVNHPTGWKADSRNSLNIRLSISRYEIILKTVIIRIIDSFLIYMFNLLLNKIK